MSSQPSRLAALITAVSTDPSLLESVTADPAGYVATLGLDVIEAWAFLARDQRWIDACIREGQWAGGRGGPRSRGHARKRPAPSSSTPTGAWCDADRRAADVCGIRQCQAGMSLSAT